MRGPVEGAGLVEIRAAGIEVANGAGLSRSLAEHRDQCVPVRHFREKVRHVDANQLECREFSAHYSVGLGQFIAALTPLAKSTARGDQYAAAAWRRHDSCRVVISEGVERRAQAGARFSAAVL